MLMILLNLSYIPDEVVQKINFTPGWQKEFKANMEEYKKKFMREHEVEWQFQNQALEDKYRAFKLLKEK